jgi:large conductance mechanosensitive channel
MSLKEEFKSFIAKGNVVDLAVAVIMGGAFGKVVLSPTEEVKLLTEIRDALRKSA